ncbi:molybdenum cofactor guanylyltransferase [Microbacterium sp.]|uniref:molybdenum cofactor guanylyltransferase n=1 Tax=Microbacterium sp. TaxID=51671 RepID=UPI003F969F9F
MTADRSVQIDLVGAIVLVGGRSRRMGGGFKPLLEVGGRTLFARSIDAVIEAGCAPVVAAGPMLDADAPVHWAREDPPFTGPVAAIEAALTAVDRVDPAQDPRWSLLLAGDLPRVDRIVQRLIAQVTASDREPVDAYVFTADGQPQWLAGIYRTAALRTALAAFEGELAGASCRALLGELAISWIADDDGITADIDTPADLARIRAEFEEEL